MELFLPGSLSTMDMEFINPSFLCLLLLAISPLVYLLSVAARRPSLPPGPSQLPLVGNLLSLGGHPHRDLTRLAKVHGPVMTFKLGFNAAVVISSAEAAKEVLQEKDKQFSGRWVNDAVKSFRYDETSMIFQSPGKSWKQMRSICSGSLFSNKALDATCCLRQRKVRELVAYFREHAGRPVKIVNAILGTMLNVTSNIVFSKDLVDLKSKSTQDFRELLLGMSAAAGKPNVSDFFGVLRAFDLQGRRRSLRLYLRQLFDMFDSIIDDRLRSKSSATSTSHGDFLDTLLQLHDESKLDRITMRSLLADMFVAGGEAIATTLEWAMAELLHNPAVLSRAQNEIEEVIGSRKEEVEESDVEGQPYLQAVVKEVLRLHPPAPLLPHRAVEDRVELGGYAVPKDTQVIINVWAIARDERIWPEPNAFNPERFLGKEYNLSYRGRDFVLLPFSSGRRTCPGLPLAERMLHLTLSSLLHGFVWRLPEGIAPAGDMNMEERFGLSLCLATPLRVVAFPRSRSA